MRLIAPNTLAAMALVLALSIAVPTHADSPARNIAAFSSGPGIVAYLAAGSLLPLTTDHKNGKNHAFRVIDSGLTSVAFSEGLARIVQEKRPDSNARDSFPSDHATAAFAVATAQSALHPGQALYWYAGATVIGWSRLRLNEHHPQDVIAGAALGFGVTRWEFSEPHGLILQPWIHQDAPGVMIQRTF